MKESQDPLKKEDGHENFEKIQKKINKNTLQMDFLRYFFHIEFLFVREYQRKDREWSGKIKN